MNIGDPCPKCGSKTDGSEEHPVWQIVDKISQIDMKALIDERTGKPNISKMMMAARENNISYDLLKRYVKSCCITCGAAYSTNGSSEPSLHVNASKKHSRLGATGLGFIPRSRLL